jgi:hypothetical protein
MPNMRIISTNLADTATVIQSSTTASGFSASNLQNDYKSSFHRSTGSTVTYTIAWSAAQIIGGISLPCTNLSKTATVRVQLYSDYNSVTPSAPATLIVDTGEGTVPACPDSPIANLSTSTINGNLFQLGVLSKTSVWFPNNNYTTVRTVKITLADTSNPVGYIDCARIVCGSYWQPTYNASRDGLDLGITDTSQNSRTDAGDLVSDRGFIHDELSLNLGLLTDTDRNNLLQLMRTVGTNRNILVSVFPSDYTDTANRNKATEQQYTVYGKRNNSNLNYIIQGYSSSSMNITGW